MSSRMLHPCTQEGCTVAVDGKCLEGLPLGECPYYQAYEEAEPIPQEEPIVLAPGANHGESTRAVTFHGGDYLTASSAREITRKSLTRVIIIAGEPDSGKTTLVGSLNDAFQKGPFAGYAFAGSLTLPGLERVCYKARLQSGRARADTERTKPTEEIRFLHLSVRDRENRRPMRHLLLADISGERLELVKNSTEEAAKLDIVERADHVALLIDGEKLTDSAQRHRAKNGALLLLRSWLDAGVLGSRSFVDVVLSKWDVVEEHTSADQIKTFIDQIRQDIENRFGARLARLRFFEVAARPDPKSPFQPGYGLDEMFASWVEDSPLLRLERDHLPALDLRNREFARFHWAAPGGQ